MGIYDRDYYRKEGPSYLGSLTGRAPVCKWLIAINVIVFIVQLSTLDRDPIFNTIRGPGPVTSALQLAPDEVLEKGHVWQLLTYAFLHDHKAIWHILFNMLILWWMGNELEEMYGSREFLTFYLLAAIFAGICFVLYYLMVGGNIAAVGASGAITAMTVVFAYHFPNRTVLLMFVIPMPIWLLVVIFVAWDFLQFIFQMDTKTAVAAHLGGALFGYLYYKGNWRLASLWSGLGSWRQQRARPKLRIYREEEPAKVPASVPEEQEIDEHLEAKLDAVLEKMSLVGKDNLTEGEKEILLKASEIYKKRRN